MSKGFVFEQQYSPCSRRQVYVWDIFREIPRAAGTAQGAHPLLLRRFFRKIMERDPVVVPLVITL
jgi:ribonuclease J